ncbi:YjjG family noncanonical pyrimidine nucleotidase [Streptococcus fryi]
MYYKYLLFDLDHTLLDFDTAEDLALTALLEEHGVDDIKSFKDYYKPMNKQLWRDLELGTLTKSELVNTRFSKLFAHFGIEMDGVYLAERYQTHLSLQGQSYDGAYALLDSVTKQGYQVYAATNGIETIQRSRIARSGLETFFTQVFISEEIGIPKPNAAFFNHIADQIVNFSYDKALMIGDSLTADVKGGNNVGLDTVWYNPSGLDNHTTAIPTYTVQSYSDLLALLK